MMLDGQFHLANLLEIVEQSTFEGCPMSPFSLYRMLMREKGGKDKLNPTGD